MWHETNSGRLFTTFIILLSLIGLELSSQELPPIQTYLPKDYNAETQNWAITQTKDNYIYVANNKGLLEFNGFSWELYTLPNQTIIRSVRAVGNRIYMGSYMEFGYWDKDAYGTLQYTSLVERSPIALEADEQFWKIIHIDNRILFQSLNRIHIYDLGTGSFQVIQSKSTILNIFKVNKEIYFQELNVGISKIHKGKGELVITAADLGTSGVKVVELSHTPDGLLILTDTKGFFTYKNAIVEPWDIPAKEVLKGIKLYSGIRLKNGDFALGTISNGLMYLSKDGTFKYQITQTNGLANNTVLSLFEDQGTNIWLGLDIGISCVNVSSPVQIYEDTSGKLGTVYTAIVHKNILYLGTNQGLFFKNQGENQEFTFVEGTKGQVWSLFAYQNTLFCGHDAGTLLIEENNIGRLIYSKAGTWYFRNIPDHPNWLLIGTYAGFAILEQEYSTWKVRNEVTGFKYSARTFDFFKDKLWVNHEYKGVFRMQFDESYQNVSNVVQDSLINRNKYSSLVKYNNQLLCANRYGIFSYRPKKDKFIKDQKLSTLFTTEEYSSGTLIADETSRLWNFTVNNINYISPGQFSEQYKIYKIPISSELRQEMVGFETMVHLENDKYLIGRANGYMILDNKALNLNQYEVLLDRVAVKEKGKAFREIALNVKKLDIPFAQNTIRFEYSVPHYDKFINPKFQYRLEGFYDEWSDWTDQSYVEFENLPANSYNLMVRSKSGAEMNKNVIKYAFNIDKPWYLSTLSYILYVVLFCFIVALTHRSYKRYYAAQKTRLLAESQKQLERKQLESEKEIMRLKNERLIQDIENKNRELASSTLSVIQKNELLNSIKAELQKSRETGPNIQSVKKIIDKSINSKDDWKNFEEAFKNTDKDFLKKLKSLHANLTPNDLRFCTYLRLNLSSKEIAPLLNISVRSIEIKRYRLRKKLNLQHSESLVNYILSI